MHLYVEPMDATLVGVDPNGQIRFENEDWSRPTLQERRAIIYAAQKELEALTELIDALSDRPR